MTEEVESLRIKLKGVQDEYSTTSVSLIKSEGLVSSRGGSCSCSSDNSSSDSSSSRRRGCYIHL